ncbi:MAG: ATP-binding protein [Elusimicrobiota bacterium]
MEDKTNRAGAAAEMRRRAEELFLKNAPSVPEDPAALPPAELKRILHELRVHQIELEMQNEELCRAQAELDAQRERYFDLYDLAPVGYLTISDKGLIAQGNLTAAALLGAPRNTLAGQPFSQFILKEDHDSYYLHLKQLLETGEPQACELRLVKKDGTGFWAQLSTNAAADAGAPGCRLALSDITARKQAELQKAVLMAALEEKERELANFLYAATHDLRTPLVNIQGYSGQLGTYLKELQAALAQTVPSEELKKKVAELLAENMPEALGYITGGALKMNQLISALLKVARLGRLEMTPAPLNMNSVLKSVADTFAFELERTGGAVTIGPLPSCTADAAAISQVFANIISNAVKYRDPARKLEITVTGRLKDPATALYTVANNGLSIPATDLEKIWGLFYSGGAQDAAGEKGEGIGLPVAKRIICLSGGKIHAESKEGAGAVFYVELPAGGGGRGFPATTIIVGGRG